MIIGKAIYAALSGNSAVNAIVSGRIYPAIGPEVGKDFPEIVYGGDAEAQEQEYAGPDALTSQSVRIECHALTYAAADALANAVRVVLDGQSGTWGGIVVQGAFLDDASEATEANDDAGQESVIYVFEQQYTFWFVQPG